MFLTGNRATMSLAGFRSAALRLTLSSDLPFADKGLESFTSPCNPYAKKIINIKQYFKVNT